MRADGTESFKYDPFGRRIYKSSSTATSIYAYDGDNLVEEANASGSVVARYSQGLNIDEPLAMLRSCRWRINTMAVKRSDPRNAVQLTTQTPDDFMRGFCRS